MNNTIKNQKEQKAFEQASKGKWEAVFTNACTGDWKEQWFLA